MTIYETLNRMELPWAYGRFIGIQEPPFLIVMGNGQNTFSADNTYYHRDNRYRVEYYYKEKNEANEDDIEETLLSCGFLYEKSEDEYIDDEDLFVIYYYIQKGVM